MHATSIAPGLNSNARCVRVDPAPGTAALLDTALADAPPTAFAAAPAPPVDTKALGYRVGQRIPAGVLRNGAIAPSGPFALPIDAFSDYCLQGGLPIGARLDNPPPASVRRCAVVPEQTLASAPCASVLLGVMSLTKTSVSFLPCHRR